MSQYLGQIPHANITGKDRTGLHRCTVFSGSLWIYGLRKIFHNKTKNKKWIIMPSAQFDYGLPMHSTRTRHVSLDKALFPA